MSRPRQLITRKGLFGLTVRERSKPTTKAGKLGVRQAWQLEQQTESSQAGKQKRNSKWKKSLAFKARS